MYRILQEDGYLRIDCAETITLDGLAQAFAAVGESDRQLPQPRLWVFPEQLFAEFSLRELRQLVESGVSQQVAGKAAFVASTDLVYGKIRQATLLRPDDADRFAVFRSEEDAIAWLMAD